MTTAGYHSITLAAAGALMLAATAADVALTVLHPEREGALTRRFTRWYWLALSRVIWKTPAVSAERKRTALALLGPLVTCLLIGSWLILVIVSYAVLYLPYFEIADPRCGGCIQANQFVDALYYSAGVMARVSTGSSLTGEGTRWLVWSEGLIGLLFLSSCLTFLFGLLATVDKLRPIAASMTLRAAFAAVETMGQPRRKRKRRTGIERPDYFVQTQELRFALQRYPLALYYAPVNTELVWYLLNLILVMADWHARDIKRLTADKYGTSPQAVYWDHLLQEVSYVAAIFGDKLLTRKGRDEYRSVLAFLKACAGESTEAEMTYRLAEQERPLEQLLRMLHRIASQLYLDFLRMPFEVPALRFGRESRKVGDDEFTCAMCGKAFKKAWSDEEAAAEAEELWLNSSRSNDEFVCDPCFRKFRSEDDGDDRPEATL